jgi:hypothetical protein
MTTKTKYKQFQPEDLDDALEEANDSPENWVDDFLTCVSAPVPGPRRGVSFRFLGRNMACSLPIWAVEVIEDMADRDGVSRSQWVEAAVLQAMFFRAKVYKELGDAPTSMSMAITASRKLRAAREMRAMETLLEYAEEDLKFWVEQQAPESVAKTLSLFVEAIEPTPNKDLRLAKIRYAVDNWQWVPAGLALLKTEKHSQHDVLKQVLDKWEKEGIHETT